MEVCLLDYQRMLEGKRAFITTGARGIGKAIAVLFARQGAVVAVGAWGVGLARGAGGPAVRGRRPPGARLRSTPGRTPPPAAKPPAPYGPG